MDLVLLLGKLRAHMLIFIMSSLYMSSCMIGKMFIFPFPVNSTRVSNELGAGNPQRARSAVRVAMFLAVTETILVSGTIFSMRHILGYAYSNEEEIVSYVREMAPLVCVSIIMDSLQGVLSGNMFLSSLWLLIEVAMALTQSKLLSLA